MSKFKQLSVVIVNYRSQRYLKQCIASLYERLSPEISWEILIINNDRDEDLNEVRWDYPEIEIQENENDSLGKAWNRGAHSSRGEILWFLNPDTRLLSADFEKILAEFKKDPALAVLGPGLIDPSGRIQEWSAGRRLTLGEIVLNNLGHIRNRKIWESPEKKETDWVSGAAFLVRRDFWDKARGFDEKIVRYFEDMDFCLRIRNFGGKVVYFPSFRVEHLGGGSHQDKQQQKIDFYASQDYYFKKHLGQWRLWLLKLLRKMFLGK